MAKESISYIPKKKRRPFVLILIKAIAIKVLDHLYHCATLENNSKFKPLKTFMHRRTKMCKKSLW
jgi:hypothetical protein